jgi:hypothetical protein
MSHLVDWWFFDKKNAYRQTRKTVTLLHSSYLLLLPLHFTLLSVTNLLFLLSFRSFLPIL